MSIGFLLCAWSERAGPCYPGACRHSLVSSLFPPQSSTLATIILLCLCHHLSLGFWTRLIALILRLPHTLSCQLACLTRAFISLRPRRSAQQKDSLQLPLLTHHSLSSRLPSHRLALVRTALQHRPTPVPPITGTALCLPIQTATRRYDPKCI